MSKSLGRSALLALTLGAPWALRAAAGADADMAAVFEFFKEEGQVITATKTSLQQKEVPASVSVITADEIARYGYRSLAEALRGVTGFNVTDDKNYSYAGVRGFNILGDYSTRVLILIDGNTTNDPIYGTGFIGHELGVDMDSVKRIEVVMGPGSAIYGSHALFAVINVITKTGEDVQGGSLSLAHGSGQMREPKAAFGARLGNGLDFYLSAARLSREGVDPYAPEYADADTPTGVFGGGDAEEAHKLLAKLGYGPFKLEAGHNLRRKAIGTGASSTVYGDSQSYTLDGGGFVQFGWAQEVGDGLDLSARAYHRDYEFKGHYRLWYPNEQDPARYVEDNVSVAESSSLGGEAQLNWRPFAEDRLTLGGEWQNHYHLVNKSYDLGATDSTLYYEYLNDVRDLKLASIYAQNIYRWQDWLSVVLGGRYDQYSTSGDSLNPRAGLIVDVLENATLKLLYGTAFNAPTIYNLYYQDGLAYTQPNPGLKPETLQTLEAVLELAWAQNVHSSVAGYQNSVRDLVVLVTTDDISPSTGANLQQYRNQREVRTRGVDVKLRGEWRGLRGKLGASYQETRDTATELELYGSPRDTANAGLSLPLFGTGFTLTGEEEYVGGRKTISGRDLDRYFKTDVILHGAKLGGHIGLTFKVSNVFDNGYAVPFGAGGRQDAIAQDRRGWVLKLTDEF